MNPITTVFARGALTVVHDPDDDAETTATALAAHNPAAGQITVHPTVGTASALVLAGDILAALGCRNAESIGRGLGTATKAFAAVASWIEADRIEVVIVTRAHLLSNAALTHLSRLAHYAPVRIVVIWHAHRPADWADALHFTGETVREVDDLHAVLAGARVSPEAPPPPPKTPLPPATLLPTAGVAHFRAEAKRTLSAAHFAAVDIHYRDGMRAGCRFAAGNRRFRGAKAATASQTGPDTGSDTGHFGAGACHTQPPPSSPATAASGYCAGAAAGLDWVLAPNTGGAAELQAFLAALVATAPDTAATIARIRGAQAALLVHGLALQVPPDLLHAAGPGLTGRMITTGDIAAIRAAIPHPQQAAAVAICMSTGLSPQQLLRLPVLLGEDSEKWDFDAGSFYTGRQPRYVVPLPARPLVSAAALFGFRNDIGPAPLLEGITAEQVIAAAEAAALTLPAPPASLVDRSDRPWHACSALWRIGHSLHATQPYQPVRTQAGATW